MEQKSAIINGSSLMAAFQRGEVDIQRLERSLPNEVHTLNTTPLKLKPEDMSRIFAVCAAQTDNPHFGLHMVAYAPLQSMGLFGYLLLNAPTIGEMLSIGEKYFSTYFLGARFKVTLGKYSCKMSYHRLGYEVVSPHHGNEWALGLMVHLIRVRLGDEWCPLRTRFANTRPEDCTELNAVFGANLLFDQTESSIEINTSFLSHAIAEADTKLLHILTAHGDKLLSSSKTEHSLQSRVEILIFENISQGHGGEELVAKKLHMSASSLKRRLASLGLSYRSLREETIMNLARSALRDTSTPAGNIGLSLGYSDASAFSRAFSRAQGLSPLAYRNSAQ